MGCFISDQICIGSFIIVLHSIRILETGMFLMLKYFQLYLRFANSFNHDIGDWNTSSSLQLDYMFLTANDIFNQDIGNWNTSNVTTHAQCI